MAISPMSAVIAEVIPEISANPNLLLLSGFFFGTVIMLPGFTDGKLLKNRKLRTGLFNPFGY